MCERHLALGNRPTSKDRPASRRVKYTLAGCAETEARVRALERAILYEEGLAKMREEEERQISHPVQHPDQKTLEMAERAQKRRQDQRDRVEELRAEQEEKLKNETKYVKHTGKLPSYMMHITGFMRDKQVSTRMVTSGARR